MTLIQQHTVERFIAIWHMSRVFVREWKVVALGACPPYGQIVALTASLSSSGREVSNEAEG